MYYACALIVSTQTTFPNIGEKKGEEPWGTKPLLFWLGLIIVCCSTHSATSPLHTRRRSLPTQRVLTSIVAITVNMFILLTVVSEGFLQEPKGVPELWENQQPSSSMHKFIRGCTFCWTWSHILLWENMYRWYEQDRLWCVHCGAFWSWQACTCMTLHECMSHLCWESLAWQTFRYSHSIHKLLYGLV